jgi:uncharacterized protein YjbI with pentapeptide repeats
MENPSIQPDLIGADLRWKGYSNAFWSGLHLNLRKALLDKANLSSTILPGTDFTYAHLAEADLHGSDLSGARLYGANLSGAILVTRTSMERI